MTSVGICMTRIVSTAACIAETSAWKTQQWLGSSLNLSILKGSEHIPPPIASLNFESSMKIWTESSPRSAVPPLQTTLSSKIIWHPAFSSEALTVKIKRWCIVQNTIDHDADWSLQSLHQSNDYNCKELILIGNKPCKCKKNLSPIFDTLKHFTSICVCDSKGHNRNLKSAVKQNQWEES